MKIIDTNRLCLIKQLAVGYRRVLFMKCNYILNLNLQITIMLAVNLIILKENAQNICNYRIIIFIYYLRDHQSRAMGGGEGAYAPDKNFK